MYTLIDLEIDFKADTGSYIKDTSVRGMKEYMEWLEEQILKLKNNE